MYVGWYAICVLNWNWWLTQDRFLIKHWIQRTHRCQARVVGLEDYSLVLDSRYSTVRSGTLTWREWGLWWWAWYNQSQWVYIHIMDPEWVNRFGASDKLFLVEYNAGLGCNVCYIFNFPVIKTWRVRISWFPETHQCENFTTSCTAREHHLWDFSRFMKWLNGSMSILTHWGR